MDNQDQVSVNDINSTANNQPVYNPPSAMQPTTLNNLDNSSSENQLEDIKNQAIAQLTPMVQTLDQSPEERFKTLLMLIQASDNQALIKDAFEAAQQISDKQSKAQALLDIVNEINYFSSNQNKS